MKKHHNALRRSCAALFVAGLFAIGGTAAAATSDFSGVWAIAKPQTLFTPVGGAAIPFTTEGKRAYDSNKASAVKGDYIFDKTMSGCASPGQPRLMLTPKPFAIYQRSSMIMIVYQWNHMFRQIQVGKQLRNPLLGDDMKTIPTAQGYSDAEWDGDTLVVKTINLQSTKLLDNLLPSGDDLVLTEHLRLRDANTLEDRITITDANNFSSSWDTVVTYQRQSQSALPFAEDVCRDRLQAGQSPLPK
jgi:hypothetical protein